MNVLLIVLLILTILAVTAALIVFVSISFFLWMKFKEDHDLPTVSMPRFTSPDEPDFPVPDDTVPADQFTPDFSRPIGIKVTEKDGTTIIEETVNNG